MAFAEPFSRTKGGFENHGQILLQSVLGIYAKEISHPGIDDCQFCRYVLTTIRARTHKGHSLIGGEEIGEQFAPHVGGPIFLFSQRVASAFF